MEAGGSKARLSISQKPIFRRFGYGLVRVLMWAPLRRTSLGQRAYTSIYLLGKGMAEKREANLFRRKVRPGMTIADMGANIGFYTVLFSRLVGPSGKVHAFEPDPFCFRILKRRLTSLTHRNVRAERVALGERQGEATLYCSMRDRAETRTHPLGSSIPVETLKVPVNTVDAYCRANGIERIDAVKMDVEGAEVAVLRGMRDLMSKSPPAWMFIEFSTEALLGAASTPEAFWQVLEDYGYECFDMDEHGELRKILDTRTFSAAHADEDTNILAVHRGRLPAASV